MLSALRIMLLTFWLLPASAHAQAMFSPYVATRADIAARMVALGDPKPGETVIDLGSGDGRIVFTALKERPGVKGVGVDINEQLVRESNARAFTEGLSDRVRFLHQNVFDADLRKVDVIFMWLFPELQRLLRNKIFAEARPGTRIVTQTFDFGNWQADQTDSQLDQVRLWIVPANIVGNWNWSLTIPGEGQGSRGTRASYAAIVDQQFQQVDAVVRVGRERRASRIFTLRGDEVKFSLTIPVNGVPSLDHDFAGRVRGNVMEGTVRLRGKYNDSTREFAYTELPWRAVRSSRTRYFEPTGVPRSG